jgi:hypothetical protein
LFEQPRRYDLDMTKLEQAYKGYQRQRHSAIDSKFIL